MNRLISAPASKPTPADEPHPYQILWRHQIIDPSSDIANLWNYAFLMSCLIVLFIDPLHFYVPRVGGPACLERETRPAVVITLLPTLTDLFYLLHMSIKFSTAFVAPSSRVFRRGGLVMDPREIAIRYLKTDRFHCRSRRDASLASGVKEMEKTLRLSIWSQLVCSVVAAVL